MKLPNTADVAIPIKTEPIEVITIKDEPEDAPEPWIAPPIIQNLPPPHTTAQINRNPRFSSSSSACSVAAVIKPYSMATVPKFDETGRVLTLGQRLARIRKQQELEQRELEQRNSQARLEEQPGPSTRSPATRTDEEPGPSSRLSPATPTPSTPTPPPSRPARPRSQLDSFAGTNYTVTVKVLVTNIVQQIMYKRGKQYYEKDRCKIKISRSQFPEFKECQVYLKGLPKQVLECLYVISEDIRIHVDRRRVNFSGSNHNREEMMYIVTDRRFMPEILRYYKGKRMIRHIEEEHGVWIRLEDRIVEGECVVCVTGHKQQMRDGLRHLMEEISMSSFADSLPALFHYIPSPHYNQHALQSDYSHCPWVACDRTAWHHWLTFRDYRDREMYSTRPYY